MIVDCLLKISLARGVYASGGASRSAQTGYRRYGPRNAANERTFFPRG
jgi:hypothetical protein